MRPVEIIALVFVLVAFTKMIVILVNPLSWKIVIKKTYAKPIYTSLGGLVLAGIILNFLLKEMTIVQIFAAMTFMMALMMVQFAGLGHEISELSEKYFKDRQIIKKVWFSLVIWTILMFWVLLEIISSTWQ